MVYLFLVQSNKKIFKELGKYKQITYTETKFVSDTNREKKLKGEKIFPRPKQKGQDLNQTFDLRSRR